MKKEHCPCSKSGSPGVEENPGCDKRSCWVSLLLNQSHGPLLGEAGGPDGCSWKCSGTAAPPAVHSLTLQADHQKQWLPLHSFLVSCHKRHSMDLCSGTYRKPQPTCVCLSHHPILAKCKTALHPHPYACRCSERNKRICIICHHMVFSEGTWLPRPCWPITQPSKVTPVSERRVTGALEDMHLHMGVEGGIPCFTQGDIV